MFIEVFIIQCQSTGEFLTPMMNYTHNLNKAGYFFNRQAAIDTAMSELNFDFVIYSFYKREADLPASHGGGSLSAPPM